jgi:hypothetical protein
VLAAEIALERLEPVTRRRAQVAEFPWLVTSLGVTDFPCITTSSVLVARNIRRLRDAVRGILGKNRFMASNLTTIGFEARTEKQFRKLALRASREGTLIDSPNGRYVVWPTKGPEQLWAQLDRAGALIGLNPHFAGFARIRVAIQEIVRNEQSPLDGYVWCWAAPVDEDPASGEYPFVVDLPNFDIATSDLEVPWFGLMQVPAFARSLNCWDDDATYGADQDRLWASEPGGQPGIKGLAADSFIPSGTFTPSGEAPDGGPAAEAMITGHVLRTELRTNSETGRRFWHVLVRTLGGEFDIVADPEVIQGEPVEEGVVQGSFWLTGMVRRD